MSARQWSGLQDSRSSPVSSPGWNIYSSLVNKEMGGRLGIFSLLFSLFFFFLACTKLSSGSCHYHFYFCCYLLKHSTQILHMCESLLLTWHGATLLLQTDYSSPQYDTKVCCHVLTVYCAFIHQTICFHFILLSTVVEMLQTSTGQISLCCYPWCWNPMTFDSELMVNKTLKKEKTIFNILALETQTKAPLQWTISDNTPPFI